MKSSPRKALLVEPEEGPAAELESLLTALGFDVTTVTELNGFPEVLGERRYDLAVINVPLPTMTWPGTLEAAKELSRTTTVITVRRSIDPADLRLALGSGSYAVLKGPLTREKLAEIITAERDGLFVLVR